MPQYLVAMYLPDDYDPSVETEQTIEEIHALNRDMDAAGVTKFAGGLSSVARSLRKQPDGKVLVTDGPYTETKEHIGGLSILEAANLDDVLAWARRGAAIGSAPVPVEVREILAPPPQAEGSAPAAAALPKTSQTSPREQYFVAIYHPDNYNPSLESKAMIEDIHALNREMIAAGARKFACGLSPAANAKVLRKQPNGKVLLTDGPYTETKEHIGGFWVLEAADLDEAVAWARKGSVACRAPAEVRQIFFRPAPEQVPSETR